MPLEMPQNDVIGRKCSSSSSAGVSRTCTCQQNQNSQQNNPSTVQVLEFGMRYYGGLCKQRQCAMNIKSKTSLLAKFERTFLTLIPIVNRFFGENHSPTYERSPIAEKVSLSWQTGVRGRMHSAPDVMISHN